MARVLLVDDDRKVRDLIGRFLSEAGHRVEAYASGSQALHRLAQDDFDVLIGDFCPGDLYQVQILGRIADLHPTLPVLVLSRCDDPQARDRALRLGARGYLVKPFDLAYLLNWVEEASTELASEASESRSSFPGPARRRGGERS
jgi:DNA-binding response OmpR family regulator